MLASQHHFLDMRRKAADLFYCEAIRFRMRAEMDLPVRISDPAVKIIPQIPDQLLSHDFIYQALMKFALILKHKLRLHEIIHIK